MLIKHIFDRKSNSNISGTEAELHYYYLCVPSCISKAGAIFEPMFGGLISSELIRYNCDWRQWIRMSYFNEQRDPRTLNSSNQVRICAFTLHAAYVLIYYFGSLFIRAQLDMKLRVIYLLIHWASLCVEKIEEHISNNIELDVVVRIECILQLSQLYLI